MADSVKHLVYEDLVKLILKHDKQLEELNNHISSLNESMIHVIKSIKDLRHESDL